MRITISYETTGNIISFEIPEGLTFEDFQAFVQAETDLAPERQRILKNGRAIGGSEKTKTVEQLGIADDDFLALQDTTAHSAPGGGGGSGSGSAAAAASAAASDPLDAKAEEMRNMFLGNPQLNAHLQQTNPQLHSLLHDRARFKEAVAGYVQQQQQFQEDGYGGFGGPDPAQQQELQRLYANPEDPESQARILELIQQEQIQENMKLAYEISPETFTRVELLYINICINGRKIQALVDTGAQATIMSAKLADELGLARLIDKRYSTTVQGVGTNKSVGRIHSAPITVGDSDIAIPCSFMVLDFGMDVLIGIDMLRRHKCAIDLTKNSLVIGDTIEAKFLQESEITRLPEALFEDHASLK